MCCDERLCSFDEAVCFPLEVDLNARFRLPYPTTSRALFVGIDERNGLSLFR